MKKRIARKRTVYASLYKMDDDRLKAHVIFIVGKNGRVEDYFPGPFTFSEYFGKRIRKKEAGILVCSFLKESHPNMKLNPKDVKLYPFNKANELYFRLTHK